MESLPSGSTEGCLDSPRKPGPTDVILLSCIGFGDAGRESVWIGPTLVSSEESRPSGLGDPARPNPCRPGPTLVMEELLSGLGEEARPRPCNPGPILVMEEFLSGLGEDARPRPCNPGPTLVMESLPPGVGEGARPRPWRPGPTLVIEDTGFKVRLPVLDGPSSRTGDDARLDARGKSILLGPALSGSFRRFRDERWRESALDAFQGSSKGAGEDALLCPPRILEAPYPLGPSSTGANEPARLEPRLRPPS